MCHEAMIYKSPPMIALNVYLVTILANMMYSVIHSIEIKH